MHELLLFASVPSHQHHELLQQLAGLTAMQPRHCLERRLVFKAYRKPGVFSLRTGASQDVQPVEMQRLNKMLNGNIFYTQLVGPVSEGDFGSKSLSPEDQHQDQDISMTGMGEENQVDYDGHYDYDYDRQPWRLEFRDIPEAATRSAVTSRLMSSASLPHGDVMAPINAWGYRLVGPFEFTLVPPLLLIAPSALLRSTLSRATFLSMTILSCSCIVSYNTLLARRNTRSRGASYHRWSKWPRWIRVEAMFYRLLSPSRMAAIRRRWRLPLNTC